MCSWRMEKGRLLPVSQPEKSLPSPSWEMQPTCSPTGRAHPSRVEQGAQVTSGSHVTKLCFSRRLQSLTWACIMGLHVPELLESQQAPLWPGGNLRAGPCYHFSDKKKKEFLPLPHSLCPPLPPLRVSSPQKRRAQDSSALAQPQRDSELPDPP